MFQATNKWFLKREDLNMATKRKSYERNWITSNSSTKQRHNYIKVKINDIQRNIKCRGAFNKFPGLNEQLQKEFEYTLLKPDCHR